MKKLLTVAVITLLTLSSYAQTNKKGDSLTITLSFSQWQSVINALQELPAKVANPITDIITKEYYLKTQPAKKP